ncbi:MAG TPA: DNA repair protein RadC [Candidatus Limnocylindrales bacterium]|nr:DNA repair protein RadC [Candidatus Limnocylindrales bacterium]
MSDARADSRHAIRELGPSSLSSADLLEVICGADVGSTLLARHGSLSELARADFVELRTAPGVGAARAAQIAAAFELGRRAATPSLAGRWVIRSPRDVADRLIPEMAHLEREELRVLLLNTKNAVIRAVTVYQGNVSAAVVRVAELFRDAVRVHAAGIVMVHNHPSGEAEPSADDLHLTAEAVAAGRLLDIALLDHVILAADSYVSLRDRGVAFDRR